MCQWWTTAVPKPPVCKPAYLVPVPRQDKLGWLCQEGHPAWKWCRWQRYGHQLVCMGGSPSGLLMCLPAFSTDATNFAVNTFLPKNTHTDRQTDRQTDGKTVQQTMLNEIVQCIQTADGLVFVWSIPAVLVAVTDGSLQDALDVVLALPVRRRTLPVHCTTQSHTRASR